MSFCIENTETPSALSAVVKNDIKHIVLVHGYAASLGLFIDNFDQLSAVPESKSTR